HWVDRAVIRVWIDPARAPAGGDALVERAMKTWTAAAGGRFRMERIVSRENAAVRVHFFTRDWRYGMTQAVPDPRTGVITNAEVVVASDAEDRKSTRLNSSHDQISYAVFCLKKKNARQG